MGFIFNFIKSLIIFFIKFLLYFGILVTVIVLIPNLPPYTKFTKIVISPEQPRVGPLAPNNDLNNAVQLHKGKLNGPEAFQVYNGDLYTGLVTGEIVKITPAGHITFVTKIGQPCTGITKSHICGRPLGFTIDEKHNALYVADAYYGIWKVDLKTDKKQLLVSPRVEIKKRSPKLFNSVVLSKNGDLYWSDSTSDYFLHDGALSVLSDPSGRVFHYNAAKNESKVLVDVLWFANGLALSPNEDFLIILETGHSRLLKHYLSGPKAGQTDVFVDGLPGTPDNVRVLPDGSGLLVGLYAVNADDHPLIQRSLAAAPVLRKFIARLQRLIEIPFEYLNSVYPHILFEEIVFHIGHFKSVSAFLPPVTGLVQIDWNGNIVASYYNTDGSLGRISEGIVYNGQLYIGSPHQDFIGLIPLPPLLRKAYETTEKVVKVDSKPQAQAKPTEPTKPKVVELKHKPEQLKPKEEVKPKVVQKPAAEQKPKEVPKPKAEEKPIVEQKPKEEKPKVEQKPKEEKPKVEQKPKVETKPKAEEKKEIPKAASGDKKPKQQAKQAVPVTPVKVQAPELPKKETPPPAKAEAPKTAKQQEQTKTTTPKPETKPTEKNTEPPKNPQGSTKPPVQTKEIPIKEEIVEDTAKPPKEKLKVIKRGGVKAEIPVPANAL